MHRVTESIEINSPIEKVFSFLRNVEDRMRLSPVYRLLSFTKLTDGNVGVGTRFRIVLLSSGKRSEYESEVVEFVENRRIATRDTNGRMRLTLTLREVPRGTLLTHDEEFVIPADLLYPVEDDERPLWQKVLQSIISLDKARFVDREREERIEAIKSNLSNNLRLWLNRIKEVIESGGSGGML
ncbi:MAG: hypothetical protein OHK0032_07380 [Thermodesulfovibrionales bacterium]